MQNSKFNLALLKQMMRYLMVGGIATLSNYLIFIFLLRYCHVHYMSASGIGYVLSVGGGFYFNKKWTFGNTNPAGMLLVKYFLMYGFSLLVSTALLYVLVERFYILPQWANVLTITVAVVMNFFGLKYLVFKSRI